ncbi:MAG: hypothetical protein AAGD35_01140 [Actinomycetota bacterium]
MVAALVAAVVVAGCGSGDGEDAAADGAAVTTALDTAPVADTEPADAEPAAPADSAPAEAGTASPCDLVDGDAIEELAGATVTSSTADELQGVPRCVHLLDSGGRVQVVASPAVLWAGELTEVMGTIAASEQFADEANQAKIAKGLKLLDEGAANDPAGACELFSVLAELQGIGPGQSEVVNFVPDATNPLAVNAQGCADGVYTSVQLQDTGLLDDPTLLDRIAEVRAAAHQAAAAG